MNRWLKWTLAIAAAFVASSGASLAQTAGKPIIAIYEMDDLAKTGEAENFSRMLETAISGTSKFRVMERSALSTLVGEQARARSGLVTTNTPGKIGGFEGADYLVYGSITSASTVNKNLFGMRAEPDPQYPGVCMNTFMTLGIDIKITDAHTGEVKNATRVDETQRAGTACLNGTHLDTTVVLRSAADKVATSLVTAIYPMQVASVQADGVFVLNYGEGAVQVGQVLSVFTKGEAIIDPATGEKLANDEQRVGFIKVTAVQGRISRAVAVDTFTSAPSVGAIVRIATPAELDELKGRKRR